MGESRTAAAVDRRSTRNATVLNSPKKKTNKRTEERSGRKHFPCANALPMAFVQLTTFYYIIYCELLIVINFKGFVSNFAYSISSLCRLLHPNTISVCVFSTPSFKSCRWLLGCVAERRTDRWAHSHTALRFVFRGTLCVCVCACAVCLCMEPKHRFWLTHLLKWQRLFYSPTKRTITKH